MKLGSFTSPSCHVGRGNELEWDGNFPRLYHVTHARLTKLKAKIKLKEVIYFKLKARDHEEWKKNWRSSEETKRKKELRRLRTRSEQNLPQNINLANKTCYFRLLANKMTLSMIKDSKLPASFQWIFSNKKPRFDRKTRAWSKMFISLPFFILFYFIIFF